MTMGCSTTKSAILPCMPCHPSAPTADTAAAVHVVARKQHSHGSKETGRLHSQIYGPIRAAETRLLVEVHITAADAHSAHLYPHVAWWDVCGDVVVLIAEVVCAV